MADAILSAPHFHNEEAAFAFVEALLWPAGPHCPKCGATDQHIGRLTGKTSRVGLRKCYACRGTFTVRVGTIFEDSHLPLHLWLQAIHLLSSSKKGISTRQIQRLLNCSMKTAWFLTHRIREIMAPPATGSAPLGGHGKTVEIDETFVGGKAKNMHKNKRSKVGPGGIGKEVVFSLVERGGRVTSHQIPAVKAHNLREVLRAQIEKGTFLMTDEGNAGRQVASEFGPNAAVNHSAGEYVRGDAHINTVESYFAILKRGLIGVYHGVSQQHLKRYLAEFDFRYNEREALGVNDAERANRAILGAIGKRLTYETTANSYPNAQA